MLTPHQMEWQRVSGIKIADQTAAANLAAAKKNLMQLWLLNPIARKFA